ARGAGLPPVPGRCRDRLPGPAALGPGRRGAREDAERRGHRPHRLLRARLPRACADRRAGDLPRLPGVSSPTAFERALEQLGTEIVAGTLPADATDTIEGFMARTGASRSVVREVTRVLGDRKSTRLNSSHVKISYA